MKNNFFKCLSYPDQIHQQGGLEHPVKTHVFIGQQVLQAAPVTVLRHHAEDPRVEEKSQEQI